MNAAGIALARTAGIAADRAFEVIPVAAASRRWGGTLFGVWLAVVVLSSVGAADRTVWAAETILPAFVVAWLAATSRSFPLSRLSYACVFLFLALHQVGAHYTYPQVPYPLLDEAGRNHYDRFVHAAYGVLFAYPLREVLVRLAGVRGFWAHALPVSLVMSTSLLYEFIEWLIAARLGPSAAPLLGAQGDAWDAHWDLLLATAGAAASTLAVALAERRRHGGVEAASRAAGIADAGLPPCVHRCVR